MGPCRKPHVRTLLERKDGRKERERQREGKNGRKETVGRNKRQAMKDEEREE